MSVGRKGEVNLPHSCVRAVLRDGPFVIDAVNHLGKEEAVKAEVETEGLVLSETLKNGVIWMFLEAEKWEDAGGSEARWILADALAVLLDSGWSQRGLAKALDTHGLGQSQISCHVRALGMRDEFPGLTFAEVAALTRLAPEDRAETVEEAQSYGASVRSLVEAREAKVAASKAAARAEEREQKSKAEKLASAMEGAAENGEEANELTLRERKDGFLRELFLLDSLLAGYVRIDDASVGIGPIAAYRDWLAGQVEGLPCSDDSEPLDGGEDERAAMRAAVEQVDVGLLIRQLLRSEPPF